MARPMLLLLLSAAVAASAATASKLPPGYHDCGTISGPPVREPWRTSAGEVVKKVATSGLCHDAANKTGFSWGVKP